MRHFEGLTMKVPRYYQVIDGTAYVYDAPYPNTSQSVSIVSVADLAWYRAHFALSKIWGPQYGN
jgi:hypothetical protein